MNLANELIRRGYRLRREGNRNHRLLGKGGLIIKDNFWYSHSKGLGGNAASLLTLLGETIIHESRIDSEPVIQSSRTASLPSSMGLYNLGEYSIRYLINRGIDPPLIEELNKRGLAREDRKGYICFCGYNEKQEIKCITNRAIRDHLNIQKYERTGSDKRYSFWIKGELQPSTCIVAEGPIDIISIACMENLKNKKGYFQCTKIATCGAPPSHLLSRLKNLNIQRVILAMDGDTQGQEMKTSLEKCLHKNGFNTTSATGRGKDPNDWLKAKIGLS